MNKPSIIVLFVWLCSLSLDAQTLRGVVVDEDGRAVGQVLVKARHVTKSLVVLGQAYTDDDGAFSLSCGQWEECMIEVESSFYQLQPPVKATCGEVLRLVLEYKTQGVGDIIVRGEAIPIIDKGDTILYKVAQLRQAGDLTMEDLLRRLPDIHVDANGQVSFRGRKIDRILINGQAVVLDHTLLTRTITPEMLSKMEIRTKEDNSRLKQQLLENASMLVLDFTLDEKVKENLFGQLALDAGKQEDRYRPNGHGSAFTLRPRYKGMLFVNWDYFDKQVINGDQLRELDPQSFDAIFDLPANPELLKKRSVYHNDIFGFEDYYRHEPQIAGAALTLDPHSKWNIKTGFFFSSDRAFRRNSEFIQIIGEPSAENEWRMDQRHSQTDFKSRIVSTCKFNDRHWFTTQFFFKTVSLSEHNEMLIRPNDVYFYTDALAGWQANMDANYEYKSAKNWNFRLRYHYMRQVDKGNNFLRFENADYAGLFFEMPTGGREASELRQRYGHALHSHSANVFISRIWGEFALSVSVPLTINHIDIHNSSESPGLPLRQDKIWGGANQFSYARHQPRLQAQYSGNKVRIGIHTGIDQTFFDSMPWRPLAIFPVLGGSFALDLSAYEDFRVQYRQSPADIVHGNLGTGILLTGVNGWMLPAERLILAGPQSNANFALTSRRLQPSLGISLDLSGVYGRINNADALRLALDSPIWREAFVDLQQSGYFIGGLTADWRPRQRPSAYIKGQAFVFQTTRNNITAAAAVANRVHIYSIEFSSNFKKQPLDLSGELYLRTFYTNPASGSFSLQQQTLSSKISLIGKFLNKKLLPQISYRGIQHTFGGHAPLNTIDFNVRYAHNSKWTFYFEGFNILNQREQIKVDVDPLLFARSSLSLLPAHFRAGLRYLFI